MISALLLVFFIRFQVYLLPLHYEIVPTASEFHVLHFFCTGNFCTARFAEAFESALNDMMEHKKWEEDWSYPPMGEGDDDEDDLDTFYEEETMESYFQAFEKPDLGTWCFGK